MKKLVLMLVAACCLTSVAGAQEKGLGFGPRVGLNVADYLNSGGKARAGLHAGAFLDYYFNSKWAVETGVYYSQMGSRKIMEAGYGRTDHLMDYVVVPLMAKLNLLGNCRVMLGVEGMFLTSAQRKIQESGEKMKIESMRSSNLTFSGGVGYQFPIGLDISATYSKGFYSVKQNFDKNTHPTVYRVAVGWRFLGTK